MANIDDYIEQIKTAPRGEDVRDAIIGAIKAIDADDITSVNTLSGHPYNDFYHIGYGADRASRRNSFNYVTSNGIYEELTELEQKLDAISGESVSLAIPVESITLIVEKTDIDYGETIDVYLVFNPVNTINKSFSFTNSNNKAIRCEVLNDYSGYDGHIRITGLPRGGNATLTVTSLDDPTVFAEKTIHVTAGIMVSSITISGASQLIEEDSTALTATVTPSNAYDRSVTWSSSNSNIATVDQNGVVTAKAVSVNTDVVITAAANDGSDISATYTLTIAKRIYVSSITVNASSSYLYEGSTAKILLSANIYPSNATNKTVNWVSSNINLATVDEFGYVTAASSISSGDSVTIWCESTDGSNVKGYTIIEIKKVIHVTSIRITGDYSYLCEGYSTTLQATIEPSNATYKDIVWSVSDTGAASITQNGVVTASRYSGATEDNGKKVVITAKSIKYPNVYTNYEIIINKPVTNYSLSDVTSGYIRDFPSVIYEGEILKLSTYSSGFIPPRHRHITCDSSTGWGYDDNNRLIIIPVTTGTITITDTIKDGSGTYFTYSTRVKYKMHISILRFITKGNSYQLTARRHYTRELLSVNWSLYDPKSNGSSIDSSGLFRTNSKSRECEYVRALLKNPDTNCADVNSDYIPDEYYVSEDPDEVIVVTRPEPSVDYWGEITHPDQPGIPMPHGWTSIVVLSDSGFNAEDPTSIVCVAPFINLEKTKSVSVSDNFHVNPVNRHNVMDCALNWHTSDRKVAIVDQNGVVYAIGAGTATITATLIVSGLSATCTVNVTDNSTSQQLIISGPNSVYVGGTIRLTTNTSNSINWISSNSSIASVNSSGVVTGVALGTVTITAYTTDGTNKSATFYVTVEE